MSCIQLIDELLIRFIAGDSDPNLSSEVQWKPECKYKGDFGNWLPQKQLPNDKIYRPQIVKCDDTFIIIGSELTDNCYIYNMETHELELITLENKFPSIIKNQVIWHRSGDIGNTHTVIPIDIKDNTIKKYLLFGHNYGDNTDDEKDSSYPYYMFECIYNLQTNSIKFIDLGINKEIKLEPRDAKPLLLNENQYIILASYSIEIYDFVNNRVAHYKPKELQPIDEDDWCYDEIMHKTKNNKIIQNHFIIWGGQKCYELILNNNDGINVTSYTFTFKKLSHPLDDNNIQFPTQYPNIEAFSGFSYVQHNDYIICFGGRIDVNDGGTYTCETLNLIHLYDINKNKWHQLDPKTCSLPNTTWRTTTYLQYDKYNVVAHILGGYKLIGETVEAVYTVNDTNHWRLDLGYTVNAKTKIWNILIQNTILSIEICKIVFDYVDCGFMAEMLNKRFKPFE